MGQGYLRMDERQFRILFWGSEFSLPRDFRAAEVDTRIKAVLSDDEGMGQKAYRNPACIMPGCTGEDH